MFYGSVPPKDRTWEWESRGWPLYLLVQIIALIAQQWLTLVLIIFEVVWRYDYLLSCNPHEIGYGSAVLCEYSKAYVRCFPLLAVVVSIMVADRLYLYQRLYYQLLKRHCLIMFDKFSPLADPLFRILVFAFSQCLIHFGMMICHDQGINRQNITASGVSVAQSEAFQDQVNNIAIAYIVPGALFLSLLYASYDISEKVIPFNKYFEEDAEGALAQLKAHMVIIPEVTAMRCSQDVVIDPNGADEDPVFDSFIESCKNTPTPEKGLSPWRLVSTWWPAKLLLSRNMTGDECRQFKRWWYFFAFPSAGLIMFALYIQCLCVYDKVLDCLGGQASTDWIAAVVDTLFAAGIFTWTWTFTSKTLVAPILHFFHVNA